MSASEYLDRLRERTEQLAPGDASYGDAHRHLTRALAVALERVAEAYDPDEGLPGAPLLDPDLCPDWALPWLAQTLGVKLPAGTTPETARALIGEVAGWQRGTPAAMLAAIQTVLGGSKTVYFRERDPTAADPPYSIEVVALERELPASDRAYTNLVTNPSSEVSASFGTQSNRTATPVNLITNPSFETGLTGWQPRAQANDVLTNLVTNPRAGVDLTGIPTAPMVNTVTARTTSAPGGFATGIETTATGSTANTGVMGSFGRSGTGLGTGGHPVVPGRRYAARAIGVIDSIGLGAISQFNLRIYWYKADGSGSAIANNTTLQNVNDPVVGVEYEFAGAAVAPADAAFAVPRFLNTQQQPASWVARMTGVAMYDLDPATTVVPEYHDGAMVGCAWTGAAHASTSTRSSFSVTDEVPARNGSQCVRLMRDIDAAGASSTYIDTAPTSRPPVAAGQHVALRVSVRAKTIPRQATFFLTWMDAGGTAIETGATLPGGLDDAVGGWTDITAIAGPAPANTASVYLRVSFGASNEGEVHYIDSMLAVVYATAPSVVPPYFDGSVFGFKWTGTAHASTSDPMTAIRARESDWAAVGSWSTHYAVTRDDGANCALLTDAASSQGTNGRFAIDPTHTYAFRVRVRLRTTTWATAIEQLYLRTDFYNVSTGGTTLLTINGAIYASPSPGEYDLFVIAQPPAGALWATIRVNVNLNPGVQVADIDADAVAMFDLGVGWTGPTGSSTRPEDVPAYVDGTLPGCVWTGAAHASTSTRAPTSTVARDALLSQKPAGLLLNFHSVPGYDWTQVVTVHASWTAVKGAYSTWNRLVSNQPG